MPLTGMTSCRPWRGADSVVHNMMTSEADVTVDGYASGGRRPGKPRYLLRRSMPDYVHSSVAVIIGYGGQQRLTIARQSSTWMPLETLWISHYENSCARGELTVQH
ncbi:hypothetical protein ACK280_16125 [Mycobacterium sherrisii]|uniref:hypothetical protein n=1 Tax=Mycobacterium sherrisii TaxID=243061 RepID=UPI003975D215